MATPELPTPPEFPVRFGDYRIVALRSDELDGVVDLHFEVLPSRQSQIDPQAREKMRSDIASVLSFREGLCLAALSADERAAAYKIGYRTGNRSEGFYSWIGGVHPAHRRRGLARALLETQHAWAKSRGLLWIETQCWGDNRAMLLLNLAAGMDIVGALSGPERTGVKAVLRKRLRGYGESTA